MKVSREVKIAFLFILALALFIWGINFLKGSDIFKRHRTFYAIYERVDGLVPSNPITIKGFKVGQVTGIRILEDGSYRILVTLTLNNPIPIPSNSVAVVFSSDLIGSREIGIRLGDSPVMLQSGDTIVSEIQASLQEEVNRQVAPLKAKAEDLITSIDSMVTVIRLILDEDMREGLHASLGNIRIIIDGLKHTASNIDTLVSHQRSRLEMIIVNVESISNNIKANNEQIAKTLRNVSQISDSLVAANLSKTITQANQVLSDLAEITGNISEGKGSLGLLVQDDTLYKRLDASAKSLDLLLEDMRVNPHRYVHFSVFGRNPKNDQGLSTTKEPR